MNAYKKIKYILYNVQDSKVLTFSPSYYMSEFAFNSLVDGTCNGRRISLRGVVPVNKTSLTRPRLEKCLYQVI